MRAAVAGAALFGLALSLRALPLRSVFTAQGILPGHLFDEYYHLRRIWYSVVNFPEVLAFDPYVNFPDGGAIHWPPGFDWGVAVVARALVGAEEQVAVETVAVWVPPVLGALAAVGVASVGRAAFGVAGGLVAGLLMAVLPASWVFSQLGVVDHHVAVSLAGVVLLGGAMAWLRSSRAPGVVPSAGLGLAVGLPLLIWPGFLIHGGLTGLGLLVAILAEGDRSRAVSRAGGLALALGVAALVVLPFGLGPPIEQYGDWSPLVLSRFQPLALGGGALILASAALVAWRGPGGASRPRRLATALAIGLVSALAAFALAPGLRESMLYASGWFTQADEVRSVAELAPLDSATASTRYGLVFFLFPLAWCVVAVRAAQERREDLAMLLLWAAGFLALALLQRRFNNSFAAPHALVWGGAVAHGLPALRRRLAGGPVRTAAWAAAGGLVLAVLFLPVAGFYAAPVERAWAARQEGAPWRFVQPYQRVALGAARWLARSTPPTRGYLEASSRPEYGVLSVWDVGHLVRYVAERPLVQDNFGVYGGRENFERARAYYASTDEDEAVALLERLGVRYVVADRLGAGGQRGDPAPLSMTRRLTQLYGSAGRSEDPRTGEAVDVPALRFHRLVYHARSNPGASLRADPPHSDVSVYERVRGARIEGRASPGGRVEAQLRLSTRAGPSLLPRARGAHLYRVRARADAGGSYTLTLPYPTDGRFSDAVRVLGAYEVRSGRRRARLEVSEEAVRTGARLPGPDLRASHDGGAVPETGGPA